MAPAEEILVGVDGSIHSRAAVGWAMAEARSRNCGVLLVHVSEAASGLWTTTRSIRQGLRELAQPVVDKALAHARGIDPQVPVRGRLILGNPRRTLLTMSAGTVMTVVGRQGRGALAAHLVGSLSLSLMAHSHNPVVAVAPDADPAARQPIGRVVVALGDRPTSLRALDFGIEEARLYGIELQVVHAWQSHAVLHHPAGDAESAARRGLEAEQQWLSELLTGHAGQVSGVSITPVVRGGRPVPVLREFCQPSDLLVLGQHRHGRYLPAMLGTVIAETLHQVPCTVAVVGDTVLASEAETARAAAEQRLASGLIAY